MLDPLVGTEKVRLKKVLASDSEKDSHLGFQKRFPLGILKQVLNGDSKKGSHSGF